MEKVELEIYPRMNGGTVSVDVACPVFFETSIEEVRLSSTIVRNCERKGELELLLRDASWEPEYTALKLQPYSII